MSGTETTGGGIARQIEQLIQSAGEQLARSPRQRAEHQRRKSRTNENYPTDPVRRLSYHESTRQAHPWIVHGQGSRRHWKRYKAAALGAYDALVRKQQLREAKARRSGVAKASREDRLRDNDRSVLFYLLDRYNHVTGWLFPRIDTIAADTGRSESFVKESLRLLWKFGFVRWVRRTKTKEGAEGEAGPQLEQTSNAYFFDWTSTLVAEARATFITLLTIGLKKLRGDDAAVAPSWPTDPELSAALHRIDAGIARREAEGGSASP